MQDDLLACCMALPSTFLPVVQLLRPTDSASLCSVEKEPSKHVAMSCNKTSQLVLQLLETGSPARQTEALLSPRSKIQLLGPAHRASGL